jgi:hypothetical protein
MSVLHLLYGWLRVTYRPSLNSRSSKHTVACLVFFTLLGMPHCGLANFLFYSPYRSMHEAEIAKNLVDGRPILEDNGRWTDLVRLQSYNMAFYLVS